MLESLLDLKSSVLYKKYTIFTANRLVPIRHVSLAGCTVALGLYLLTDFSFGSQYLDHKGSIYTVVMITVGCTNYCLLRCSWTKKTRIYTNVYQTVLVFGSLAFCLAGGSDFSLISSILLLFSSTDFFIEYRNFMFLVCLNVVGYLFCTFLNFADHHIHNRLFETFSIYSCVVFGVVMIRRKIEMLLKKEFISGTSLDSTSALAKDLLGLLLPKFVLEKMDTYSPSNDKELVFDNQERVTILFCDIADFEDVVKRYENNIVELLDRIFRKFDELCIQHGIQKIETVGKTYVAAGGLDAVESTLTRDVKKLSPTLRMLNLAKDMMTHMKTQRGLDLKIGIHIGKPVIGVIGYHKPQFSLIGDVVNTTSRHCTTGRKGHIMLSDEAWKLLVTTCPYSMGYTHEEIWTEMKGKGRIKVHHFYPKRNHLLLAIQNAVSNNVELSSNEQHQQRNILENLVSKLAISKRSQSSAGFKFASLVRQMLPREIELLKRFLPEKQEFKGETESRFERNVKVDYEKILEPVATNSDDPFIYSVLPNTEDNDNLLEIDVDIVLLESPIDSIMAVEFRLCSV